MDWISAGECRAGVSEAEAEAPKLSEHSSFCYRTRTPAFCTSTALWASADEHLLPANTPDNSVFAALCDCPSTPFPTHFCYPRDVYANGRKRVALVDYVQDFATIPVIVT